MPGINERNWYDSGLRFECTRCGNCCTGEPGYVWVNRQEVAQLADYLGISEDEFRGRFVRMADIRPTLREKDNGDCVFFERGVGCTVYPHRPRQCRSWPFWESNLRTEQTWNEVCKTCPGAGRGRLYTIDEIEVEVGRIRV